MNKLQGEVDAKYALVGCGIGAMILKGGKPIYWPDVTLEQADHIYENKLAEPFLQLKPEPPKSKKKNSEAGE